jgi:hypothetical protein
MLIEVTSVSYLPIVHGIVILQLCSKLGFGEYLWVHTSSCAMDELCLNYL